MKEVLSVVGLSQVWQDYGTPNAEPWEREKRKQGILFDYCSLEGKVETEKQVYFEKWHVLSFINSPTVHIGRSTNDKENREITYQAFKLQKAKQTFWVLSGFLCVNKPCTFWFLGNQPSQITGVIILSEGVASRTTWSMLVCCVPQGSLAWNDPQGLVSDSSPAQQNSLGS